MNPAPILALLIPVAYIIGSIPFGLIVGLSKGVDPRTAGSGNIGATNVGRLLGGKFFALVFSLDLLKGALPTFAAGAAVHFHVGRGDETVCLLWMLVGFAAIAGHLCSCFLKFKGGKGVATSTGVLLGLFPYFTFAVLVAVGVFLFVFGLSRYVSVASMIGAVSFTVAYLVIGQYRAWPMTTAQLPLLCLAILIPVMIIYRHRGNIVRLRLGTESRFVRKTAEKQV